MTKLSLKAVLGEAWTKVSGVKKYFFAVFLVFVVAQLFLFILQLLSNEHLADSVWADRGLNLIFILISAPFVGGLMMLGVKRARSLALDYKDGFHYLTLKNVFKLFLLQLMMLVSTWAVLYFVFILISGVLSMVGDSHHLWINVLALVLGIIFLVVFFSLQVLFSFGFIIMLDRGASPWQAYKGSIALAWPHLWFLIGVEIVCFLIDFLGALPLGVGLIWTVPFSFIVTGILYRELTQRTPIA